MRAPICLAIAATACSPAPIRSPAASVATLRPPPDSPAAAPEPAPPTLRLPTTVRPLRNTVELTLLPQRDEFSGAITIEIAIDAPTTVVWLNATEIAVDDARFVVGDQSIAATASAPVAGFLSLRPARRLAPGTARLVVRYRGKMRRNDGDGIYTVEENGERYAFTQFEPTDARQAFPCFDEPSYKVPWQLTIHTEQRLTVLSNAPIASQEEEPGNMKAVRFDETRPLPSYLVAFAVGPFESVDAGVTRGGAPIRIVVPRGRAADAAPAAAVVRPILDRLEDYFGSPYPYSKLDLLAVPVFNFAAMENPGLVTFRQSLMLPRAGERSQQTDKLYAYLTAHELAHQWFGDLVTMAWWDDTWLNESFATWLAARLLADWKPEWQLATELVNQRDHVMAADSLTAARAIRQPIASGHDIANAFDGITYSKGSAVLTMLERWIGPDQFRDGIRGYLAAHSWGNASYDDFLAAMSSAVHQDVRPLFDPFVAQSGVPLVSFELDCTPAARTLRLAQQRYLPTGSRGAPDRQWRIPVCVRWGAGATTGRDCTTLDAPAGELVLGARTCPDWVLPNEDELGYYRMLPRSDLLAKLVAHARQVLTLPERVGLIGDVSALVTSGDLQAGAAIALVEQLSRDPSRYVTDASVGVITGVEPLVPLSLRSNYGRLIRKLYRDRAAELGWRSRPGEDDNTRQLRSTLLWLVAGIARDPALSRTAERLVTAWLNDRTAIDPDLVGIALNIAAHRGSRKLFDQLHVAARAATDRTERSRLLDAMGAFIDPKVAAQAMAITLTDEFELRESIAILQRASRDARTREAAYAFTRTHFDELAARLPMHYRPYLATSFAVLCDDHRIPEIEAFLRPRIGQIDGGPRVLAAALEAMSVCAAGRRAQAPGIRALLQRY